MKNIKKDGAISTLIVALLLAAIYIDRLLPNRVIVASLYSLPILITAFYYRTSTIVLTSASIFLIYAAEAMYEHTNMPTLLSSILGFAIMSILAVQFSIQRIKVQRESDESQKARKQLQLFLGMVAHDLYQPVTSIKLNLVMLQKRGTDKKRFRKNIDFATDRTVRLIEDLKDAAAIETDNFLIRKGKTDLADILRKVVRLQKQTLVKGRIELKTPKKINGEWDGERLAQLFANVISNAIKYSRTPARIIIDAETNSNTVLIRISDNGLGMTEEQLSQAFEPFSRFHTGVAKGVGLGLYISNSIVRAHGGKMWAESKVGKGSDFYMSLPLR